MNREEKHELVIKLSKEGKTMREISKQVHMSFGDIGSVIRKVNEESEPKSKEKSEESQALKLFRKGKAPLDVVISLDLSPSKVAEIYKQFWELEGLYGLLQLFERIKPDISLLLRVYEIVKKYDLAKKDLINIANYADEYDFLKEEIEELGGQFSSLLKQRHDANDSLQSAKYELERVTNDIHTYNEISEQKRKQIENLNNEIKTLDNRILRLKDSDEYYSKFEKFAEEKLRSIMKDHRWILSMALDAVIDSVKKYNENEIQFNDPIFDKIDRYKQLDLSEQILDKLLKELIHGTFVANKDQGIIPVSTQDQFDHSDTE
jgi:uncharacterized protein YerC